MKNTIKLLGIIALVALIGFAMASCDLDSLIEDLDDSGSGGGSTTTRLSGTYTASVGDYFSGTIMFSSSNFTMYYTDGNDSISTRGTYSISGTTLTLYGDGDTARWTIVDANTLKDATGWYWYK